MKTKIAFFGTYEFAAVILKALITSGLFDIESVITQPDKPVGRHQEIKKSPVKILAEDNNLTILQPESLKNFEYTVETNLNIVVEYGLLIPEEIISKPKYGTINIHPSLLPKYRGPSPIQSALLNGERETGISIMLIDDKMDHGPILAQEKVNIEPNETFAELRDRLAPLSAELLLKTLPKYLSDNIKPSPQNENEATFCKILTRDDGKIYFNKTADEIYNQYRGLTPWPGIFTVWNSKRLKIIKIKKAEKNIPAGQVKIENNKMLVGCSKDAIEILEIQLEGKKAMPASAFVNGNAKLDNSKF